MVWIECTGVPGALGDETNIGASLGGCRVEDDNGADIVGVCSGLKERWNKSRWKSGQRYSNKRMS